MCGPIALVAVAAIGAVSAIQKGFAEKTQADFQAKIAKRNSQIAQRKADDARRIGQLDARQSQIDTAQVLGRQRAAAAGGGLQVDQGSALDITADTAAFGKLDELTIRNNAERAALGFESQATIFQTQRKALKAQGRAALVSGFLGAAGSVAGSGLFGGGAGATSTPTSAPNFSGFTVGGSSTGGSTLGTGSSRFRPGRRII